MKHIKHIASFSLVSVFSCAVWTAGAFADSNTVAQQGSVTSVTLSAQQANDSVDFVNAKPMDLNLLPSGNHVDFIDALTSHLPKSTGGNAGFSPGGKGNGKTNPVQLGAPVNLNFNSTISESDVISQDFGTSGHPFSTSKVNRNTDNPYRQSGKLFFKIGTSSYVCSASLIKPGVIVTAAHCVAEFGQSKFYSNWKFVPGYLNGAAPYGVFSAKEAKVLTSYYNGTDACYVAGVVCENDVAVIALVGNAGSQTGWYGYGVDGYGYTDRAITQITQIGYPVCLNNGSVMQRNDSAGYVDQLLSFNTVIGSLMCGGSSGGPWLINFGLPSTLTGTTAGTAPLPNIVVGVTSWGYIDNAFKEQGASRFTSGNITVLVNAICTTYPGKC